VADYVWSRLGDVPVYVEPFAGSLAVLLARPHPPRIESVTDLDGHIANVWRAIRADPATVAHYADDLVCEVDLHSRHAYLVRLRGELTERLLADPAYYDARAAGWWCWGASSWIGRGWCEGTGPWQVVDGRLVRGDAPGIERQPPHLGTAGTGVHRLTMQGGIDAWMAALQARLRRVRVCCGAWDRILAPAGTVGQGITGVFLDPPYPHAERKAVYAVDYDVWSAVRAWAAAAGDDKRYRIVLAGYSDEPATVMPSGWTWHTYKTNGGYGNQGTGRGHRNRAREVLWCSPYTRPLTADLPLFAQETG
jgi:hypothetical protein